MGKRKTELGSTSTPASPRRRRIPVLYCIGSLFLFGAWVSESQFERGWRNQREELDHLQFRASINEVLANTWFATLMQLQSSGASPAEQSSAALQYVNFVGNVFSASMSQAETDAAVRDNIGRNREAYLQDTLQAHQAGNNAHVLENANPMRKAEEVMSRVISAGNLNHRRTLEAEENAWNLGFRILYIAGSVILAVTFLRDKLSSRQAA